MRIGLAQKNGYSEAYGCIGDWQGNVRAVRGADGTLEQQNAYYPFGAPSQSINPTANSFKFSGKQLETRFGLNFSHHGARLLLHDLALFASPDPLAEMNYGVNPYLYCSADPINRTDPTGLYETKDEAIREARKNYRGQTVKVILDKESLFWYIEYAGKDGKEKDFGPRNPYKLSNSSLINLLTALGFSNDVKISIAEFSNSDFAESKYGKLFIYLGKIMNIGESITSFYSIILANDHDCKSDRICYKFLLDGVINLAVVIDPEPVSKGWLLGMYYTYVITDIITNGWGLDYEVRIPLFKNKKKK